jgi:ParB/RepB/Spo0J family partition protein
VRETTRREARQQIERARYGARLVLPVDDIQPNPHNPRKTFSEESINRLASSLHENGQLQPVVVRRVGDAWQLIAGERRWRAHRRAGLELIEAIERQATDTQALKLALIENLEREDIPTPEKVAALDQLAELVDAAGVRPTARELGIDPSWLLRRVQLRKDPIVFPALEAGRLGFRQAAELLRAPAVARRSLLDRALRDRASGEVIRQWSNEAKRAVGQAQQSAVASLITARPTTSDAARPTEQSAIGPSTSRFASILAALREAGPPQSDEDLALLTELEALARELRTGETQLARGSRAERTRSRASRR